MARYSVPDAEELQAASSRAPLVGGEDYRVRLLEVTTKRKTKYQSTEMHDVWVVKMAALSFADGAPLEDVDGNAVEGERWLWCDLDPTALGFQQNGTASKTRQFLLSSNGISDMSAKLPDGDTDELIGREFLVHVEVNKNRKNKVTAFRPISKRRGRAGVETAAPAQEAPVSDDVYAAAVARLLEGKGDESDLEVARTRLDE